MTEPDTPKVPYHPRMAERFRGYLPVVIDVETGGFNAATDALLEIAAIPLRQDAVGNLHPAETWCEQIAAFPGANLEPDSLAFTGIQPDNPLRGAIPEQLALTQLFQMIRRAMKASACKKAILVGHNAFFDLSFIHAAVARTRQKRNPFHPFSTLDTVTLAAACYGQTALARAIKMAGMTWDATQAHGALYDAEKTAALFCQMINHGVSINNDNLQPNLSQPKVAQ